jgi:hypothetical protein
MGIKNDAGADTHTDVRVYEGGLFVVGLDLKFVQFSWEKYRGVGFQDYGSLGRRQPLPSGRHRPFDHSMEVPSPTTVELATDLQRETVRAKLLITAGLESRCSFVEGSSASSIFAKVEISFMS